MRIFGGRRPRTPDQDKARLAREARKAMRSLRRGSDRLQRQPDADLEDKPAPHPYIYGGGI